MKDKYRSISLVIVILVLIFAVIHNVLLREVIYSDISVEKITLTGLDGTKLKAKIYKPASISGKLPAVIVIHGLGESEESMSMYASNLARNNFVVLSINYRGHDGSGGGLNYIGDPVIAPNMTNDIFVAYQYLIQREDVDTFRISVVGHSFGARVALAFGLLNPGINAVVMISPYFTWEITMVNTTNPRNLLIIVGSEDKVTPPVLGQMLYLSATGMMGLPESIFGKFEDGSARNLIIIDKADHYSIIKNKKAVEEAVKWLSSASGQALKNEIKVPQTYLLIFDHLSYILMIIGLGSLSYLVHIYIQQKSQKSIITTSPRLSARLILGLLLSVVFYIVFVFFAIPKIVEVGWEKYQFAKFSGAQYIMYLLFLSGVVMVIINIIGTVLMRKSGAPILQGYKDIIRSNLKSSMIFIAVFSVLLYVIYNLFYTGLTANYLLTPKRLGLMFYIMLLLVIPVGLEELFYRYFVQLRLRARGRLFSMAMTVMIQYALRIIPLIIWSWMTSSPETLDKMITSLASIGLITNIDIVKTFIGMNVDGLLRSFIYGEALQAILSAYWFELRNNIISTVLIRLILLVFPIAAVMALL